MLRHFIVFILSLPVSAFAQEFSFPMYFIDAMGNRDTVVLGYDAGGTNGINTNFGELNIFGTPFKSNLDVRAGNNWWKHYAQSQSFLQGNYPMVDVFINESHLQTKKQIVQKNDACYLGAVMTNNFWKVIPIIELQIRTNNWPVTAYWNSNLFADDCRNGAVLTSMHPGAWWDGGFHKMKAELRQNDTAVIQWNNQAYSIDSTQEKIPVYWVAFGDSSLTFDDIEMEWLLTIDDIHTAPFVAYPNPANDKITFSTPTEFGVLQSINIYNQMGQIIISTEKNTVDISDLNKGMYFADCVNLRGQKLKSRFLKQ